VKHLHGEKQPVQRTGPTPLQVRIMRRMTAGDTDALIASNEYLSERTIRRRIREVMDEVGATSRVMLTAEAVRRGWLDM
jgi:DNA-binding NarL/FixJ family response regulator